MEMQAQQLAERLKSSRESCGLTQEQVAEKLSISIGTLSGYERGYRKPNPEMIAELAKLYNVQTDYLLGLTNDRRESPFATIAAHKENPLADITEEEQEQLLDFLEVIRKRKNKGK